jgi:hypothetical protein
MMPPVFRKESESSGHIGLESDNFAVASQNSEPLCEAMSVTKAFSNMNSVHNRTGRYSDAVRKSPECVASDRPVRKPIAIRSLAKLLFLFEYHVHQCRINQLNAVADWLFFEVSVVVCAVV